MNFLLILILALFCLVGYAEYTNLNQHIIEDEKRLSEQDQKIATLQAENDKLNKQVGAQREPPRLINEYPPATPDK